MRGIIPTVACRESGAGTNLINKLESRGSIPSVVKFFQRNADTFRVFAENALPVCGQCVKTHRLMAEKGEGRNQNKIARTTYCATNEGNAYYLPGSALKGVIHTALLNRVNAGAPRDIKDDLDKKILGGTFSDSPMRFLKVADLLQTKPVPSRIVMARRCYKGDGQALDRQGGIPAPLNFEGFPKSVCTSINEVVCHGIPSEDEILQEGDIINVDVSTILDGYYSDASRMFIIGKTTPEKEKLVRVTKECLEIGMRAAKPFGFVGDIGNAIQRHAEKNGFSVVRDLCGHGVGLAFHEEPEVLHFGRKGTGMLLVPGMVFTIEPMINMGDWHVFIDEDDGWTVVTDDEKPSAQWEHTFLMTENGLEILTY